MNVGTIGHVDHGKTTLTAAITKGGRGRKVGGGAGRAGGEGRVIGRAPGGGGA